MENSGTHAYYAVVERARREWQSPFDGSRWQKKTMRKLGGWKTLSMVDRYAHKAPGGLQVAASRLDNVFERYALATPKEKRD